VTVNAAGNMTTAPQPGSWSSAYTLTWDAWNRLVKVASGAGTVAACAYDGLSRRTTKVISGVTRDYYYTPQWQIVEERVGGSGSADRQFVWGLRAYDDLVLRDYGSQRMHAMHDYFNCTAIADTTGTVQERYGYNGFGQANFMTAGFGSLSGSSYGWETLFANYRWDDETGLYQVRYRYQHPGLGRWLSRDPISTTGGKNLYEYVRNNPVRSHDPLGLQDPLPKAPPELFPPWYKVLPPVEEGAGAAGAAGAGEVCLIVAGVLVCVAGCVVLYGAETCQPSPVMYPNPDQPNPDSSCQFNPVPISITIVPPKPQPPKYRCRACTPGAGTLMYEIAPAASRVRGRHVGIDHVKYWRMTQVPLSNPPTWNVCQCYWNYRALQKSLHDGNH